MRILCALGPVRLLLVALTVTLVVAAPFAEPAQAYGGVALLVNEVAPALAVIDLFLLLLDLVMSRVLAGSDAAARARLRLIQRTDALLLVALVAAWGPFAWHITRG